VTRVIRPHSGSRTEVRAGSSAVRSRERGHQAPSSRAGAEPAGASDRRTEDAGRRSWDVIGGETVAVITRTLTRAGLSRPGVFDHRERHRRVCPYTECPRFLQATLRGARACRTPRVVMTSREAPRHTTRGAHPVRSCWSPADEADASCPGASRSSLRRRGPSRTGAAGPVLDHPPPGAPSVDAGPQSGFSS